ncbi:MAG: HWE histidine kinase domain-containing protein [Pseudomonadota bacterium]
MPLAEKFASDLDFDRLLNALGVPIMVLDRDLKFVFANDDYCKAVRKSKAELIGEYVFDAFPDTPERVAEVLEKFNGALAGDVTYMAEQDYTLEVQPGVWSERVWKAVQTPYRNSAGEVRYMIQRCDDITDQVELRRQKEIISGELDHRVRNMLAVVQAVANMTADASETIEEFSAAYSGRLQSLSRNFTQLSRGNWRGLHLKDIIEDEVNLYLDSDQKRVEMTGPDLVLSIKSTKDVALIIHELATNAAKYGALSDQDGEIDIEWSLQEQSLHLYWLESGLEGIKAPTKSGFGFSFLGMMPGMKVEKDFKPTGLEMRFEIPVRMAEKAIEIA